MAQWPLKGDIDLSSGFGDFRNGRFHAGLDLRTGGVPGKELHAPVEGYVSRIRMSYYGYGKGLYVTGKDGYLYVFGHLQGFNPQLEKLVKERQMAEKRYFVELEFPADSIPVRIGQLLGYTGQTGVGAPHLHLEKRTSTNIPLNPLTHGFKLVDKVRPFFTRIGFQQTDDHTMFPDGARKVFYDVRGKAGKYVFDSVLYFNSPFGVLTDCFDRMRDGGMRQAVYKLQLFVDDALYYQVVMDSLDYGTTKSADLVYDYSEAVDGEPRVRRLYHMPGNDYAGIQQFGSHLGIIGNRDKLAVGKHRVRIVADDALGNRSELAFSFIWGPPTDLFVLDSVVTKATDQNLYYFTAAPGTEGIDLDSVSVWLNRGPNWGVLPGVITRHPDKRHFVAGISGPYQVNLMLKLRVTTKDRCQIFDSPFNGFQKQGFEEVKIDWVVDEDGGLIVHGRTKNKWGYRAQAELFYQDSLLGVEKMAQFFNMEDYYMYVPARPQYRAIDRIQVQFQSDLPSKPNIRDSVHIYRVAPGDSLNVTIDNLFTVVADTADFYQPHFIELKHNRIATRGAMGLGSDHFEILPEDLLLRGSLELSLKVVRTGFADGQLGVCRLDKEANRWGWMLESTKPPEWLHGSSRRAGSFAAVFDYDAPTISDINLVHRQIVRDAQPLITFKLKDNLSGIADDRSIVIKLDGKWQIAEYDAEDGVVQTRPLEPLALGDHHLAIEVVDRSGNKAEQYLQFTVKAPLPNRKGT